MANIDINIVLYSAVIIPLWLLLGMTIAVSQWLLGMACILCGQILDNDNDDAHYVRLVTYRDNDNMRMTWRS